MNISVIFFSVESRLENVSAQIATMNAVFIDSAKKASSIFVEKSVLLKHDVSSMIFVVSLQLVARYMIFMSVSDFHDALYFKKKNVTKFLEHFDEQCQKHCVNKIDKFRKLSQYCEKLMSNFVKIILIWINQNWEELIQMMKKKYELKNSKQQMNSLHFLKIFKSKSRIEKNDLRVYNRQFRAISIKFHNAEQINEFIVYR